METSLSILKTQIINSINTTKQIIQLSIDHPSLFTFNLEHTRTFGQIMMHIIRSLEYYLRGVVTDHWLILTYGIEEYSTPDRTMELFEKVEQHLNQLLQDLTSDFISKRFDDQDAFGLNLIVEMMHHHTHHVGQLSIFLRMNGINPVEMNYII